MTTDELYEIAQKGKGESITLGWFEGNIPLKDMWREVKCYYEYHNANEIKLFSYRKIDGKFIVTKHVISPAWIRKVNGKSVNMKYMNFKNDWCYRMLKLSDDIRYWCEVCQTQYNHRFSLNFDYYWKDIVITMIETRDIHKTRSKLNDIHWKSWEKLLSDLEIIFKIAYIYNKTWHEKKIRDNYSDVQLFQFLYNLFLTNDGKSGKISLS